MTAVSWTGGKDCNLALLSAWRDPRYDVRFLVVFRPPNAKFQAHPIPFMEAQSAALELPLLHVEVTGEPSYKASYVAGIERLKAEHGVRVICTGDMDLVGTMQRNWIEECGEECGVAALLPLWQADREWCHATLAGERFRVVFTCVKSPWFDGSWIGRELDAAALGEMRAMAEKRGLDLGGERGEYHTMCTDGPLYIRPVDVSDFSSRLLEAADGKKDGDSWWVLDSSLAAPAG